jgi:hypothetical protein
VVNVKRLNSAEKQFVDDLSTLMDAYKVHLQENEWANMIEGLNQDDYTFLSKRVPPEINLPITDLARELGKKRPVS